MRASNGDGVQSKVKYKPPGIVLKIDTVKALLVSLDWSDIELSRRSGLDPSAIHRLLNTKMRVGEKSIAGLLWAFSGPFEGRVGFPELFELDGREAPPLAPPKPSVRSSAA